MEALRSLSSRFLLGANDDDDDFEHEPEEKERNWAIQRCMELSEYDEENTIIMWIKKIKQSEHKQHKRLMVITDVRLFTARRAGSKKKPKFEVRREAHILNLLSVQEAGLILHIHFRDFEVSFECNDDDLTQKILAQLYRNYSFYDPGFPPDMRCKWLDQYKASQEADLAKRYPVVGGSLAPWERPARAFRSWAYFYKEANKDKLSFGLKSILRRPLDDMVVDDERWLHTKSLGCQNNSTIHGAILCVAFTLNLLKGVEVSEVRGDPALYFAIRTLLRYNTTLASLVLDGCASGPEWGGLMVNAMVNNAQNMSLKRFGLKNCKIGDKGVNLWIQGNHKLQAHQQPSCVYLTKANCSSKTIANFLHSLKANAGAKGLEELDISENPLDAKGTMMLANRLVKDFHNLKMLNVEKCNVECAKLLSAIEAASKNGALALEEINLSYNKMTQQDGLILSRILAGTGTCAALGLAGCGLSGTTIAACLASLLSNENLQFYARLDVSDNNIGCEAAIMFASIFVLTDRIMSLKLNNCDLTHEGMGYVLMSLLTQPRLKLLEIDFNCKRAQWNSGKYHVNQMLRKLLEKCLNLESLSIRNDPERGYQVDLDHFLHALKTNDALICLDISGNSMTSDNLAALKDVVIRNQVLRELHWDQNNITSKNILGLTHALKQNKALQMVAFPDKDFEKELSRIKSSAKKMELQMIKKNFYRAVFENATTQGFQQSTTNYKRTAAKRGSIMAQRPKNEVYQPQVGGNALGLPQFGGVGPNAGGPPGGPMGRGPPPMKGMGGGPPMNPMGGQMGGPPPGGMMQAPPKKERKKDKKKKKKDKKNKDKSAAGGMPPPNPMQGGGFGGGGMPPPNPMGGQMGGGPPQNPMGGMPPNSGSFRGGMPPPGGGPYGGGMPPHNQNSGSFRGQMGGGPPQNPMGGGMGGGPPPNPMQNGGGFGGGGLPQFGDNNSGKKKPPGKKMGDLISKFNSKNAMIKSGPQNGGPPPFGMKANNKSNPPFGMNASNKSNKSEKQSKKDKKKEKKEKKKKKKEKKDKHKNKNKGGGPPMNPMGGGMQTGPPPNPMGGQMGGGPPQNPMGGGMGGGPPPNPMDDKINNKQQNSPMMGGQMGGGPPPNPMMGGPGGMDPQGGMGQMGGGNPMMGGMPQQGMGQQGGMMGGPPMGMMGGMPPDMMMGGPPPWMMGGMPPDMMGGMPPMGMMGPPPDMMMGGYPPMGMPMGGPMGGQFGGPPMGQMGGQFGGPPMGQFGGPPQGQFDQGMQGMQGGGMPPPAYQ